MADEVWIAHPNLPGQDRKVPRDSLGTYALSGWSEREDQTDPVDPDTVVDEPAPDGASETEDQPEVEDGADVADSADTADAFLIEKTPDDDPAELADVEPSTSNTTRKGRS